MKYTDYGFRPLYKNFNMYPLNEALKKVLAGQPGLQEAEGAMVYGYVDHEVGNMLEILALTKREDEEKFSYLNLVGDARLTISIEELIDEEFEFVEYGNGHLYDKFSDKIERLSSYDVSESVAKSRTFKFLDEFRYEKNFDDVQVILFKDGLKLEGAWVRIEELGKGVIMGTLLNEPEQDFGVKLGTPIVFIVNETADKKKQLVADFTPHKKLKREDLADGKMLKDAVASFNADKNKVKFFVVLELLRDSDVIVPYIKKEISTVSSNNKSYLPVFTSLLDMWEYNEGVTKITMPFLEAIKKARKSNKRLDGIVLNAFTDSVVIPKSMFELIEGLASRIEEVEE